MSNRYVCFDDSNVDPTYNGVDDTYLVISNGPSEQGNPCIHSSASVVPLLPQTSDDLKKFAKFFGFQVVSINGVAHLKTKTPFGAKKKRTDDHGK